ncbi:MAG: hypothetical protein K6T83_13190 [Alicyclobacillus sp.]|nr:hypothetical protein [Alicyclobacillus sp.]
MRVVVIHQVTDSAGFQQAGVKLREQGAGNSVSLVVATLDPEASRGVCVWQGESLGQVREFVEEVLAPYSNSEYIEIGRSFGLPE